MKRVTSGVSAFRPNRKHIGQFRCIRGRIGWILLAGLLGTGCLEARERGADGGGSADVEAYPQRPITLLCWSNPGSAVDLFARAIARVGERHFGQRIDVVTRAGGGGAAAMSYLLSQPPDGHTLLTMTSSGTVTMAAGHIPFGPEAFTYVERVQLDPFLIAVSADSPFQNLNEFFDYAHRNPGQLSVSGFGVTSAHFLGFARLRAEAGNPDIRWIPYEGTSDAVVALLGGHVDATNNNYNALAEHVRAGTVRVLGVARRLPTLPEVPTYREQGYDVEPSQWRGIMGHGGMPPDLVRRIHELLVQTVEDPDFARYIQESATELGLTEDPEAFHREVLAEVGWSREQLQGLGLLPAPGGP